MTEIMPTKKEMLEKMEKLENKSTGLANELAAKEKRRADLEKGVTTAKTDEKKEEPKKGGPEKLEDQIKKLRDELENNTEYIKAKKEDNHLLVSKMKKELKDNIAKLELKPAGLSKEELEKELAKEKAQDAENAKILKEATEAANALLARKNSINSADKKVKKEIEKISDGEYTNFVDKNIVSEEILKKIADKVKNREAMTERETAIFNGKTTEINEIIVKTKPVVDTTPKTPTTPAVAPASLDDIKKKELETETAELIKDKARKEFLEMKNDKPSIFSRMWNGSEKYKQDVQKKEQAYMKAKKEYLEKSGKDKMDFVIEEAGKVGEFKLEKASLPERIKNGVSKGVKWYENIGNDPKDSKTIRFLKKTGKTLASVAIIGGASAAAVSALAAAGIGSAAALSAGATTYVGKKLLMSAGFGTVMSVIPQGSINLFGKVISSSDILGGGLAMTSIAGAAGYAASKITGLITKKWLGEENIKANIEKKIAKLKGIEVVGETLEDKIQRIEKEYEKIQNFAKNKRFGRRLLGGATALGVGIAVLEYSGHTMDQHKAEMQREAEVKHAEEIKHAGEKPAEEQKAPSWAPGSTKGEHPVMQPAPSGTYPPGISSENQAPSTDNASGATEHQEPAKAGETGPSTETKHEGEAKPAEEAKHTEEVKAIGDAIVHKGEGIEHAFQRQIEHNEEMATHLGWDGKENLHHFATQAAHHLAIKEGYVDNAGNEMRVSGADKVAYEIKEENGHFTVEEKTVGGTTIETRHEGDKFDTKPGHEKHEYVYHKGEHHAAPAGTETEKVAPASGETATHQPPVDHSHEAPSDQNAPTEVLKTAGPGFLEQNDQDIQNRIPGEHVPDENGTTFQPQAENDDLLKNNKYNTHDMILGPHALAPAEEVKHDVKHDLKHEEPTTKAPEKTEAKTNEKVSNNTTASGENHYGLSPDDLLKIDKLHYSNINHIFHDKMTVWETAKDNPASGYVNQKIDETPEAGQPFIKYMHNLHEVSGLDPILKTMDHPAETANEFMHRAEEKIYSMKGKISDTDFNKIML